MSEVNPSNGASFDALFTGNSDNLEVKAAVAASQVGEDSPGEDAAKKSEPKQTEPNEVGKLKIVTMADVAEIVGGVTWLWQDWIPRGFLTIVGAYTGVGKSAFVLGSIAKAVIHNIPFLDGQSPQCTGKVIWCDTEASQGGNVDRIFNWGIDSGSIIMPNGEPIDEFKADNPKDLSGLRGRAIQEDAQLIVFDTFRGAHDGDENSSQINDLMVKLSRLAQELQIAVILIHHCRKKSESDPWAKPTLRGSSAIEAMARSIIMLETQTSDLSEIVRVYSCKHNFCRKPEEFGFKITEGGICANELPMKNVQLTQLQKAVQFLQEFLKDGPRRSTELDEAEDAQGFSDSTLQRAKKKLEVKAYKVGNEWFSCLPEYLAADSQEDAQDNNEEGQ